MKMVKPRQQPDQNFEPKLLTSSCTNGHLSGSKHFSLLNSSQQAVINTSEIFVSASGEEKKHLLWVSPKATTLQ